MRLTDAFGKPQENILAIRLPRLGNFDGKLMENIWPKAPQNDSGPF